MSLVMSKNKLFEQAKDNKLLDKSGELLETVLQRLCEVGDYSGLSIYQEAQNVIRGAVEGCADVKAASTVLSEYEGLTNGRSNTPN